MNSQNESLISSENPKVLLIEDNLIVALDMKNQLIRSGIKKEDIEHIAKKAVLENLLEEYTDEKKLPFDMILLDKNIKGWSTDEFISVFQKSKIPTYSISGERSQSEEYGLAYIGKNIQEGVIAWLIEALANTQWWDEQNIE